MLTLEGVWTIMINSNLFQRTTYLMDIDFLINNTIYEYDLSKANISILREMNIFSEDLYWQFYNMDKHKREVTIGKMIRKDKALGEALERGFIQARQMFFDANNLTDNDVFAIKKDAIFTLRQVNTTHFLDKLDFKEKNLYTSFYKVPGYKIEYYFCKHPLTGEEKLDVKHLGVQQIPLHEGYMLELIHVLAYLAETDLMDAIDTISRFMELYKRREVDVGYYRTLDPNSKFVIASSVNAYDRFVADYILNDSDKQYLDISYNYAILQGFYRMLAKQYFMSTRKPRC